MGNVLEINLTTGEIVHSEFSGDTALWCLGGLGFNAAYLYEHIPAGTDPLGPENILVISPGLLTGTAAPSSSRIHFNALSPLSGFLGSSSVGGPLGVKLHGLRIRALIIRGASPTPIYLHMSEAGVKLADAAGLWGMDTRATEAVIKKVLSDEKADVLSIGPAGENLVRYACIMAGMDHSAGHTGLGAVMGSKRLKAICAQGPAKQEHAPQERTSPEVMAAVRDYVKSIRDSVSRYEDFSKLGSAGDIIETNNMGVLGTRNYRTSRFAEADRLDGRNLKSFVTRNITCPRCAVHCKAETVLSGNRFKGFKGGRPEYETIINLGSLCGLADPESLVYLSNLCNMLGLDTISTGSVIAFAMDLYDRGILTDMDTGGIALRWGDADAMEQIMNLIALRRGFGDVLAEGVFRGALRIGRGAEKYAYHVKGVELYGADPRGMMGTALSYAVSMRGGDFTSVYPVPEFRYTPERAEKEFGTRSAVNLLATEGKGALVRYSLLVSAVIDALGICKVPALSIAGNFDLRKEASLVQTITGLPVDMPELLLIGERIVTMEKLFNMRFGANAGDDTLPEKFLTEPIGDGPATGSVVDLKPMIEDFYRLMGWDESGAPLPETLKRLGLA